MTLKGTNQESGRTYNRRIVLETIRLHGPIARGDIARRVGLTVQTVSNIIRELEDLDFLTSSRIESKGRGSPATLLALKPEAGHTIGVNITPLGVEAATVNLAGKVVSRAGKRLKRPDPDGALREIGKIVDRLKRERRGRRFLGVGLAMPGPFDVESMSFVGPTTLEGWKGFPVEQRLSEASGLPAYIEADHAAAALGETIYGHGRRCRDFYFLYIGVGLGGCMVQDGEPLRGSNRNAGEIGHVPMVPGGEPCACGNRGCLERYLSLEALERRGGNAGHEEWLSETAPLLARTVTMIENLFDPQTIVIGGLADGTFVADLIARTLPLPNSISQRQAREMPRLVRSEIGPDAALRGAAALAVAGALSPRSGKFFAQEAAA